MEDLFQAQRDLARARRDQTPQPGEATIVVPSASSMLPLNGAPPLDVEVPLTTSVERFPEMLVNHAQRASEVVFDPARHVEFARPPVFTIPGLARYRRLERVVNVLLAVAGIVAAAPLLLIIAIAIRVTSRGPVLYKQPRIGLDRRGAPLHSRRRGDGRRHLWARFLALYDDQRSRDLGGNVFMIYKFRTMCEDAECNTGAVWAVENDPRTTRLGCFLRKYRLDELPQLFNVLNGDMNIVGPRPERPSIFARLSEEIDDYSLRQRAKPGITGWAQINLLYDSCIDDVRKKVKYDLEYLKQKSILRDLAIMAKTLPSVLFKRRGW